MFTNLDSGAELNVHTQNIYLQRLIVLTNLDPSTDEITDSKSAQKSAMN